MTTSDSPPTRLRWRHYLRVVVLVVAAVLIVATAAAFLPAAEWWIRASDFPRVQIAVGLLLTTITFAVVRFDSRRGNALVIFALLAALATQLVFIFPYTQLASVEVLNATDCDPEASIEVMVANVLMTNRNSKPFVALVEKRKPDMVLFLETDAQWERELVGLQRDYPYMVRRPLSNTYGMHLFSRLPLSNTKVRHLVSDDIPSIRTTVTLRNGAEVDFYGVHPKPPQIGQDTETRDAELLIIAEEIASSEKRPTILSGDLNDVAWSHTTRLFRRTSQMLDPRIGRGLFATYHAQQLLLRWPLDHVFIDERFTLIGMERLEAHQSDHFPILAGLCLTPSAADVQAPPSPREGDREEVDERIDEGHDEAREEEAEKRDASADGRAS